MEVFLLFLLYSFFGCVLEDAYNFLLHGEYVSKRTMLDLPLCPVYGGAAIVLSVVNVSQNPLILFLNGFFAVSAVELAYHLISDRIYGIKWWDYSGKKFNIMGGICLFYSALWGLLNIPFARYVHPLCSAWLAGMPTGEKITVAVFAGVYFFADFRKTHSELLRHKNGEKTVVFDKFKYLKRNN